MTAAERTATERKAQRLPEHVENSAALTLVAGLVQEAAQATRKAATPSK